MYLFWKRNKDEYERQKEIFILVVKLIWLIKQKTLKAILRLLRLQLKKKLAE